MVKCIFLDSAVTLLCPPPTIGVKRRFLEIIGFPIEMREFLKWELSIDVVIFAHGDSTHDRDPNPTKHLQPPVPSLPFLLMWASQEEGMPLTPIRIFLMEYFLLMFGHLSVPWLKTLRWMAYPFREGLKIFFLKWTPLPPWNVDCQQNSCGS